MTVVSWTRKAARPALVYRSPKICIVEPRNRYPPSSAPASIALRGLSETSEPSAPPEAPEALAEEELSPAKEADGLLGASSCARTSDTTTSVAAETT